MIRIFLLLIALTPSISAMGQWEETLEERLHNAGWKVSTYLVSPEFGEPFYPESEEDIESITFLNHDKKPLARIKKGEKGSSDSVFCYFYNARGRLSELRKYCGEYQDTILHQYDYDLKNRLRQQLVEFKNADSIVFHRYGYVNRASEAVITDSVFFNDTLRKVDLYSPEWKKQEITILRKDLSVKCVNIFDEKENLKEQFFPAVLKSLPNRLSHDDSGNLISREEPKGTYYFSYDEQGRRIKETYWSNRTVPDSLEWTRLIRYERLK